MIKFLLSLGPDAVLILQLATLAVTVVGWFYTAVRQSAILRETRAYQKQDRELQVYRARMDKASSLAKSIVEASDHWYKLAAFAQATVDDNGAKDFMQLAQPLIRDATFSKLSMAIILYDPQFRALRRRLGQDVSEKISNALVAAEQQSNKMFERTYYMQPTDPDIAQKVAFIAQEASGVGNSLVNAANYLADAFASLDEILAREA